MAWKIRFDPRAQKELVRLDGSVQRKIIHYLEKRVAVADDPKKLGKALVGSLAGLWRYRVENYRVVCRVDQGEILIVVLAVGHRKDIYKRIF